jgi:tetratricopeptide (TPR) repeat protein
VRPAHTRRPIAHALLAVVFGGILAGCPSGQATRDAPDDGGAQGAGTIAPGALSGASPGVLPAAAGIRLAQQGDLDGALPLLVAALAAAPDDTRLLEALGFVYAHTDRWQKAEATYRRALALRPGLPGGLYGLASVLADTGRYPEALATTQELLRAQPDHLPARMKEALLLVRTGRAAEGEARARAVIERAPDQAEAQYILGLALEDQGDLAGAATALEQAVALQADHLGALARLQTVLARLGRKADAERARAAHREALARSRVDERVRGNRVRGVEAFNRQDYAAALAEFEFIAREDPTDPQACLYMGSALMALGRMDEARTALRKSLALEARNERAYMELGRLEATANRLDEAVAALRRAIDINPDFPEPHYFLAAVLMAQNDAAGARTEMARFEELRARAPVSAMELSGAAAGFPR